MPGKPDIVLIIAAYCVAVANAYTAFDLGGRLAFFEARRRRLWLLAGALVLGSGTGSAWLLGLAAHDLSRDPSQTLPVVLALDPSIALLSWLAACATSLLALHTISSPGRLPSRGGLAAGGALLGFGICTLFALGVAALRKSPGPQFLAAPLAASAVLAVLGATAAIVLAFRLHRLPEPAVTWGRLAAALLAGFALIGQQILGFDAARFAADARSLATQPIALAGFGLPLALATIALLATTLGLATLDMRWQTQHRRIERARARSERLHRLACYDGATGLPNRRLFTETLMAQLVCVHERDDARLPIGVVYARLNDHRGLVERHGAERLNRVLRELGGELARQLKPGEMLARLAKDSLILMVREEDARTTAAVLSAFCAQLSTPVRDGDDAFRFGWSIGSSRFPEHGNSTQGLIRAAMKIQYQVGAEAAASAAASSTRFALAS